jgi:hypothetical protein
MKNKKTILLVILAVILAIFIGGYVMAVIWFLIKIAVGLVAIALVVAGYYFGKNYIKRK